MLKIFAWRFMPIERTKIPIGLFKYSNWKGNSQKNILTWVNEEEIMKNSNIETKNKRYLLI